MHAVTHRSCDGGGTQQSFFFILFTFLIYMFCGECVCICSISTFVADIQL